MLAINKDKAEPYIQRISTVLRLNHLQIDWLFNDLIGVNNLKLTTLTENFFSYLGDEIADLLGIGKREATGLFNLNGLLIYRIDLPGRLHLDRRTSLLHDLSEIEDSLELATAIASESVLLDVAGYWNTPFIFQSNQVPLVTASGYVIGPLIGNKPLLAGVLDAVEALVDELTTTDGAIVLCELMKALAIGNSLEPALKRVYRPAATNKIEGMNSKVE